MREKKLESVGKGRKMEYMEYISEEVGVSGASWGSQRVSQRGQRILGQQCEGKPNQNDRYICHWFQ